MTRIISGRFGGRRLATPAGDGTRPTSDRVREAVFSRLEHLEVIEAAHVLDLYCGSGALGLEAVSRGARSAQLVERDRSAALVARRNARDLGCGGSVVIHQEPVTRFLAGAPRAADLVLIDPPYAVSQADLSEVLGRLVSGGWLGRDALVVVERSSRTGAPEWPAGLEPAGEKAYGETSVFYAWADPDCSALSDPSRTSEPTGTEDSSTVGSSTGPR